MTTNAVGFGFMDNVIMILAGDAMDLTIGVRFGVSTMFAAAIGNCISDIAGVATGGWVEAMSSRLGWGAPPRLSHAQLRLKTVKRATLVGSALGVTLGCLIGMVPLLLLDTAKAGERKVDSRVDRLCECVADALVDTSVSSSASSASISSSSSGDGSGAGIDRGDGGGGSGSSSSSRTVVAPSVLPGVTHAAVVLVDSNTRGPRSWTDAVQKVLFSKHVAGSGSGGIGGGGWCGVKGKDDGGVRLAGADAGPAGRVVRSERTSVLHAAGAEAARQGAWPIIGPVCAEVGAVAAASPTMAAKGRGDGGGGGEVQLREVACAPIFNAGGGVIGALVVARVAEGGSGSNSNSNSNNSNSSSSSSSSSSNTTATTSSNSSCALLGKEHLAALRSVAKAVGGELVERIDVTMDSAYSRHAIVQKVNAALHNTED